MLVFNIWINIGTPLPQLVIHPDLPNCLLDIGHPERRMELPQHWEW